MEQLTFEFGPEHPRNNKRVEMGLFIRSIRKVYPLKAAMDLASVQPMSGEIFGSLALLMKHQEPYYPGPEEFELTEPITDKDYERGCWGPVALRHPWERAGHKRFANCCSLHDNHRVSATS